MAVEHDFSTDIFRGEDKVLEFAIAGSDGAPTDVSLWTIYWVLKPGDFSDTALIEKQTGNGIAVVGTFDNDATINTQRVQVSLSAADMDQEPTTYRYALKRTDAGNATVLSYGDFVISQVAAD